MLSALIALKLADSLPEGDYDYIGADKGALFLAKKKIHMTFAIGDFDSVTAEDLKLIKEYADEMIQLNPIKDESDSEEAIKKAIEKGYQNILIIGACGGRMDHGYVNLRLAYLYPDILTIYDAYNLIYARKAGDYEIEKNGYPFISFFTNTEAVITLDGFKYPLTHRHITVEDLYTVSNEIKEETGTLHIEEGKVLIIQSKD